MKIHIELDTSSALDYRAFLALTKIIGAPSSEVVTELPTEKEEKAPVLELTSTAMPFDEPVKEEPVQAPVEDEAPKTCSEDEWVKILNDKRVELGLQTEDGKSVSAMASVRTQFNDFVKEQSKLYGNEFPKKLTPEARYKYVQEVFSGISYDPSVGFFIGKLPEGVPF